MVNVSESVQRLIDACGAKVLSEVGCLFLGIPMNARSLKARGFYRRSIDTIMVAERNDVDGLTDYVALHELVHWTGVAGRCARPYMSNEAYEYNDFFQVMMRQQTEECTAMIGMVILATALGLDVAKATYERDKYLNGAYFADRRRAIADGEQAAGYLLNFMQQKAAA